MDKTAKLAREKGQLPDRIYNQLDDTRSIQEKYISEKERVMDALLETEEASETAITITTTTKRN